MKKRPDYAASVADTIMENESTETLTKKAEKVVVIKTEEKPEKKESVSKPQKQISTFKAKSASAGRPKGVPKKQYSIYVPEDMIPAMAAPLQYYQGDISKYLVKLINDDLERNKDAYKQLMNITIR